MPDWTYHPLSPIASAIFGEHRARVLALRVLAFLVTRAGGRRWIPVVFDHTAPPPALRGRLGATVGPSIAREAIAVLPVQGAALVEVGPVGPGDIERLRRATAGRRCPVVAYVTESACLQAVSDAVDRVTVGPSAEVVRLADADVDGALAALAAPDTVVLATPEVLIAAGPGWFNRVYDAATPTDPPAPVGVGANPRRWPAWFWGVLVGVGMVVAGAGAAAIALGPVLLWYDRAYLGASLHDLLGIDPHLVGFLVHDRLTMAGNMIAIGVLYIGLSWGGLRQGFGWARKALLISGAVTFATVLYCLVIGFVETLHTLVVAVLSPMLVLAVWRKPGPPRWRTMAAGPESQRRRALWGQLLMVGVGGGLFVAGVVISTVGLTTVFVPTDVSYLGPEVPRVYADPTLLSFIAHDRAGFGGALVGSGLAVLLTAMWGWRRGERWVWWSLLVGCTVATVPVLAIHVAIGYTHLEHLLPVYLLVLAAAAALWLARPYLCAADRADDLVTAG